MNDEHPDILPRVRAQTALRRVNAQEEFSWHHYVKRASPATAMRMNRQFECKDAHGNVLTGYSGDWLVRAADGEYPVCDSLFRRHYYQTQQRSMTDAELTARSKAKNKVQNEESGLQTEEGPRNERGPKGAKGDETLLR